MLIKPLTLFLALVLASAVQANDIEVLSGNSSEGNLSARLSVNPPCPFSQDEVVNGSITGGTYSGCNSLTSDADITSGSVVFQAGTEVSLQPGFSVSPGSSLSVVIDPVLTGSGDAYVQDNSPDDERVYAARFYIDPTLLSLTNGDVFEHFIGIGAGGTAHLKVYIKQVAGQTRVFATAREDFGTVKSMETVGELTVPVGWHWIEAGWNSASGPGSNDGSVYLCVDSLASCSNLVSLDTDQASIDHVRWGAMASAVTSAGSLDLDDFESASSLQIGS